MADTYTVVTQKQVVGQLPDGSFGPLMRVTFRTRGGTVSSLDIAPADYTADKVHEAIAAASAEIDAVGNL